MATLQEVLGKLRLLHFGINVSLKIRINKKLIATLVCLKSVEIINSNI